jgi:hypothetical protein
MGRLVLGVLLAGLTACGNPVGAGSETPYAAPSTPTSTPASPASCHARGDLPDPVCTPGVTDAHVTQGTIARTICTKGYPGPALLPPASYISALERVQILEYGYADLNPMVYVEAPLVPLDLGGDPADRRNLWPQPAAAALRKKGAENRLHQLVCSGALPLVTAQNAIAADWTAALAAYGGSPRP